MTQATALTILKLGHTTFLTGAAGAGKSYVLREYISYLKRHGVRYAVTASTGIASTHIGGTTIHAWSGIGIRQKLTAYDLDAIEEKANVYKRWNDTQVLIIDEISMLHASFVDMLDKLAKHLRRNDAPFGGMQVVFTGDFFQLPPVVRQGNEYESIDVFAFASSAWKAAKPVVCYLTEQFRQEDDTLTNILNAIRLGEVEEDHYLSLQETSKKPHTDDHIKLYTPIIKDPKGAIKALNWAIQEMERRYEILAENGQVNVSDYNKKILSPALEKARKKNKEGTEVSGLPPKMPYIVIIFDEYNDFMLSYPKEISPLITALTQKGRAAGIHLILATQRPDVKVITGTIKANIPARIALKTTSQIDSRTILDSSGAEDLLGNGDMLYMASDNPRLVRLQAPFISTEEIRAVVSHIKQTHLEFIPDQIDISKVKVGSASGSMDNDNGDDGQEPEDDEDYMSAKDYVISTGKASTSSLQTAFRWGYNKAARIINDLERYGVIGPARSGERYREVLSGTGSGESSGDDAQKDTTTDDIFRS
jgi:hypothetical protein